MGFFSNEADAELLAAGRENRVFGVGVLGEQARDGRGGAQRSIGIGAAGKRVVRSAALLRLSQERGGNEQSESSQVTKHTASILAQSGDRRENYLKATVRVLLNWPSTFRKTFTDPDPLRPVMGPTLIW